MLGPRAPQQASSYEQLTTPVGDSAGLGYGDTERFRYLRGDKSIVWNSLVLLRDSKHMLGSKRFCVISIIVLLLQAIGTGLLMAFLAPPWNMQWWLLVDAVRGLSICSVRAGLLFLTSPELINSIKVVLMLNNLLGLGLVLLMPVSLTLVFAVGGASLGVAFACAGAQLVVLVAHSILTIPLLRTIKSDLLLFAQMWAGDEAYVTVTPEEEAVQSVYERQVRSAIAESLGGAGHDTAIIQDATQQAIAAEEARARAERHRAARAQARVKRKQQQKERDLLQAQDSEYSAALLANEQQAAIEAEKEARRRAEQAQLETEQRNQEFEAQALAQEKEKRKRQLKPQPPMDADGVLELRIRMPGGTTDRRRFLSVDCLSDVFAYVDCSPLLVDAEGLPIEHYVLTTMYPRKAYEDGDRSKSLADLGLARGGNVIVEAVDNDTDTDLEPDTNVGADATNDSPA